MEESLKKSAKACKAAAAVTAEWIRDTHRSLQKQEIRWESLQQEVRNQQKEIQNLTEEARGKKQEQEVRLQFLENLVLQQGRALAEVTVKCETGSKPRRQANPPVKRPTELFKAEKPTLLKDIFKTRSVPGSPVPGKTQQSLGKGPAGIKKGSSSAPRTSQPRADTRARNLSERLNGKANGPGLGKKEAVSVSVIAGTPATGSRKAEEAPRPNLSKTIQTPAKSGPDTKEVAVKRKSAEQLEEEVGCGGSIRKPGGGKTAKLLPQVDTSLQIIPGGEACRTKAEKKSKELREPSQIRLQGGATQLVNHRLEQSVVPLGYLVGASNLGLGQESVEPQSRVQKAARPLDTKPEQAGRELPKQVRPSERPEV